jgi:WhiB family redox-sensing transcriptional regulator
VSGPLGVVDARIRPDLEMWAWQVDALCRGLPSDVFYSPDNERGASKRRREDHAKKICRACPVLEFCRRHAIELGEPYGVWGATTPLERQVLRRHRHIDDDRMASDKPQPVGERLTAVVSPDCRRVAEPTCV